MSFGGSLLEGKRKSRRPVATRTPLHVVLKSRRHDLHRRARRISAVISRHTVVRNHVVHANHIHLEVRVRSRESWCRFIRSLTAELAIFLGPGVWRLRPWTRPVVWGLGLWRLRRYFAENRAEVHDRQEFQQGRGPPPY